MTENHVTENHVTENRVSENRVSDDQEIIQAFLEESRDNLDQLDRDLVELESRPDDAGLLAGVYRTIHTIKGTCGFLGYHRLEALTHAAENLLDALRSGAMRLDAATTSSLLALVDAVRVILARIEATGDEGDDDRGELIAALGAHVTSAPVTDPTPAPDTPVTTAPDTALSPASVGPVPGVSEAVRPGGPSTPEGTVRVDVAMLDKLMDLVGELVLTRNRIGALAVDEDGPLTLPYRQLSMVTGALQESVLQARLQAMGTVTGKFRRIARDLATSLGKGIHVEVEGEDVGVDKAVNEALKDPLLHLVRNAIDHGLETPAERIAAGKSPEGRLGIRTYHEGGLVHLEVSDDGRGIDPGRLAASAVRAGILTAEAATALDNDQALKLMFRAGLSTKDHVTSISGRGVGLDVVRAQLDQVGGSIEVSSQLGLGTRFRIDVPLTLAIMTTVMVSAGGGLYAIPQVHVQEVLHLDADRMASGVDDIGGSRVLRHRAGLLSLVDLGPLLASTATVSSPATAATKLDVVVVAVGGRRYGIVIDAVGESVEVVIKPLTRATRQIPVFAGVTVLGDGQPALIIDVGGLATTAGLRLGRDRNDAGTPLDADASDEGAGSGPPPVLTDPGDEQTSDVQNSDFEERVLVATVDGQRVAVPLDAVVRLEQFDSSRVERRGAHDVVQYDHAVLPLLRLADVLSTGRGGAELAGDRAEDLQTIICRSAAGPLGLVVEHIDDVVAAPCMLGARASRRPIRPGVAAQLILGSQLTELLDIEGLVACAGLCPSGLC